MKRRHAIGSLAGLAAGAALPAPASAQTSAALRKPIGRAGRSEDSVPVVGMGTWLTFDIAESVAERKRRARVLDAFFAAGGGMIDSSPMYGRAEQVVGDLLAARGEHRGLFSATKIWTPFERTGRSQAEQSLKLWRLPRLDLVHVHNLLNVPAHLKTLRELKERGLVRMIGATTSHGRRHDEMLELIRREAARLDAIQVTYSVADDSAERILAAAAERGIAVIANRPFDGGSLVDRANRLPLPGWAREIGCEHWSQVLLKWIVSHPAITCAIPATSDPQHMAENMAAARGPMPDAAMRRRIADHLHRAL